MEGHVLSAVAGSLSVEKSTARRPQPSSTISHGGELGTSLLAGRPLSPSGYATGVAGARLITGQRANTSGAGAVEVFGPPDDQ